MLIKRALVAATSLLSMAAIPAGAAPVAGQVDDFQDGTVQGWGSFSNAIVTNVADAGPTGTGDNAASFEYNSRAVVRTTETRWLGDYTGAGITAIQFDINNMGENAINLRLGLAGPGGIAQGGGGETWATDRQIVSAGSGWTTLTFDITAADLFATGDETDVTTTLADVTQLRLFDNEDLSFIGDFVDHGYLIDNITALAGPALLVGDYSGDGFVSLADLDLVLLNWGDNTIPTGFNEANLGGDGSFDGLISQNELDGVLLNWGDGTSPSLSAVPEPGSLAIGLLATGSLIMRRRANGL